MPFADEWEEKANIPIEIYQRAAADGILMPMASGKSIPSEVAGKFPIIGGVKPEEWDGFHDFVIHDEISRVGGVGYVCFLFLNIFQVNFFHGIIQLKYD